MSRKKQAEYHVALDVGSSKVTAVLGEFTPDGQLNVVGVCTKPNRGLKKGVVASIDATATAIQRAVENADQMVNASTKRVQVSITGTHIQSTTKSGVVAIKNRVVTQRDVDAAVENGSAIPVAGERQVLHVIPQEYQVDGQEGINDPLGMSAVRLDVHVHIVTGTSSAVQNLAKCVEKAGLQVERTTISHLASAMAVLSDDERELGIACVDIGAGTTDVVVYQGSAIRHTAVIPIAGDQVTNDIAVALLTPLPAAEDIKLRYGCVQPWMVHADEIIEAPAVHASDARHYSRSALVSVIRPRYEELLRYVAKELHKSDMYSRVPGGVVLTGGAALIPGLVELAEEVLELPARVGLPHNVIGIGDLGQNPAMATAAGLLFFGRQANGTYLTRSNQDEGEPLLNRIKNWFASNY